MSNRNDLWNGNISHMVTCLPNATAYATNQTITADPMGMAYQYDQLNRILSSRAFTNVSTANNEWGSGGGVTTNYSTDYTYDAMGNILTQKRNGSGAGVNLDDLTYRYHTNANGLVSNRLYMVDDAVASGAHADDIDDQGTFNNTASTINTANNYGYDELGNLNRDVQEGIATIEWTVYGKISKVIRTGASSAPDLEFKYDASGNRMMKIVKPKPLNPATEKIYYYLRDAQGNEMCRYVKYEEGGTMYLVGEEHAMYGSSRLGVDKRLDTLYKASAVYNPGWYTNKKHLRNLGKKIYELANHLGNVLVTVTDKKVYKPAAGLVAYFEAEVNSITDYYPFGSVMSGRSWSGGGNRFGFNGHEKDNEVSGEGNHFAFGDYGYDTRLGRRWNVEPLIEKYPSFSSYMVFANIPIAVSDPDGREIRLIFESEAAKNAYIDLVNKSLGVTTKISVVTVEDAHGYTNKVIIESTGINGPLTESQQAFYDEYSAAVKDEAIVRQNVVQSDKETVVGSYYTGKVDMTDIAEFDKAGEGAASSAGALTHETVEQLEKAKLGLLPNEWSKTVGTDKLPPEFTSTHETATKAENKINGNERKEKEGYFLEKDGTKTKQELKPNSSGGVDIKKTKVE